MALTSSSSHLSDRKVLLQRLQGEEDKLRETFNSFRVAAQQTWDRLLHLRSHLSSIQNELEEVTLEHILALQNKLIKETSDLTSEHANRLVDIQSIREKVRYKEALRCHLALLEEQLIKFRQDMAIQTQSLSHFNQQVESNINVASDDSSSMLIRRTILEMYHKIEDIESEILKGNEALAKLNEDISVSMNSIQSLNDFQSVLSNDTSHKLLNDVTIDEVLLGEDKVVRMNGESAMIYRQRLEKRLLILQSFDNELQEELRDKTLCMNKARDDMRLIEVERLRCELEISQLMLGRTERGESLDGNQDIDSIAHAEESAFFDESLYPELQDNHVDEQLAAAISMWQKASKHLDKDLKQYPSSSLFSPNHAKFLSSTDSERRKSRDQISHWSPMTTKTVGKQQNDARIAISAVVDRLELLAGELEKQRALSPRRDPLTSAYSMKDHHKPIDLVAISSETCGLLLDAIIVQQQAIESMISPQSLSSKSQSPRVMNSKSNDRNAISINTVQESSPLHEFKAKRLFPGELVPITIGDTKDTKQKNQLNKTSNKTSNNSEVHNIEDLQHKLESYREKLVALDSTSDNAISSGAKLECYIIAAKNLPAMKRMEKTCDAYCEVSLVRVRYLEADVSQNAVIDDNLSLSWENSGTREGIGSELDDDSLQPYQLLQRQKTGVRWMTLHPEWRETLCMKHLPAQLAEENNYEIVISVKQFSKEGYIHDRIIGSCSFPLSLLLDQNKHSYWLHLQQPKHHQLRYGKMSSDCAIKINFKLFYSAKLKLQQQYREIERQIKISMQHALSVGEGNQKPTEILATNKQSKPKINTRNFTPPSSRGDANAKLRQVPVEKPFIARKGKTSNIK